jgi:hypothetical protein
MHFDVISLFDAVSDVACSHGNTARALGSSSRVEDVLKFPLACVFITL